MSMHKLARELEETGRQSSAMVEAITYALELLAAPSMNCDASRHEAASIIINALQGQDRIEQRCQNMALAVRQIALLQPNANNELYDEIWSSLDLDELRVPALSGIAPQRSNGDVDLF